MAIADAAELRISGKDLGALALPMFCPRCFWVQRKLAGKLPFQIFPGIFSSIDAYTKRMVHGWFDQRDAAPDWLASLGAMSGYMDPPHFTRFQFRDPDTGVRLTGAADGIFTRAGGGYVIVDYKTAKFTKAQDALMPVYRTQLNAYALIAERIAIAPVTGLALVYLEPATTDADATLDDHRQATGFRMRFDAHVLEIPLEPDSIPPLLEQARQIMSSPRAPVGRSGCENCSRVDGLVTLLTGS